MRVYVLSDYEKDELIRQSERPVDRMNGDVTTIPNSKWVNPPGVLRKGMLAR